MNPAKVSTYKMVDASNIRIMCEELDKYAGGEAHMMIVDVGPSEVEGFYRFAVMMWKPQRRPNETTN